MTSRAFVSVFCDAVFTANREGKAAAERPHRVVRLDGSLALPVLVVMIEVR